MDITITKEIGGIIAIAIFGLPPLWFVVKKAGFNPWLSFLALVPPAGAGIFILALFLGFKKWPNEEDSQ